MSNKPHYDEGLHIAEVMSQGLTKASTGTPQFVLRVKILGTPTDSGSYEAHRQQYERSIYMAMTEKTAPFVLETLQQLGFDGSSVGQLDPSHPQFISFVGNQVDLWCKHEDDQKGGWRERWQVSKGPSNQKPLEPLPAKDLRQLDMLFGKGLKAKAAPPAQAAAVKPETAGDVEITDDDIPF